MRGALALLAALLLAVAVTAQEAPALSDLQRARVEGHRLRVENAQLRAQVAELQAALDSLRLTAERAALEADLRASLKPVEGSTFDWQTFRFLPPQEPKR